jgi:uncharacterized protein YacL
MIKVIINFVLTYLTINHSVTKKTQAQGHSKNKSRQQQYQLREQEEQRSRFDLIKSQSWIQERKSNRNVLCT